MMSEAFGCSRHWGTSGLVSTTLWSEDAHHALEFEFVPHILLTQDYKQKETVIRLVAPKLWNLHFHLSKDSSVVVRTVAFHAVVRLILGQWTHTQPQLDCVEVFKKRLNHFGHMRIAHTGTPTQKVL